MYAIVNDHPQRLPAHPIRARDSAEAPREIRLSRGQTLFFEGDEVDAFFEIVSGTVRCCRLTSDGRRQIHRFAGAEAMLGVGCIASYGYTAEAVTEVVARRHRLAGPRHGDGRRDSCGAGCCGRSAKSSTATRTQMMLLGRMSAAERLASFLLSFPGNRDGAIELPMTRSDIADYLGLTIETVSRKLHELDALGVIRLETANRIHITDPGRIEAIAEAAELSAPCAKWARLPDTAGLSPPAAKPPARSDRAARSGETAGRRPGKPSPGPLPAPGPSSDAARRRRRGTRSCGQQPSRSRFRRPCQP